MSTAAGDFHSPATAPATGSELACNAIDTGFARQIVFARQFPFLPANSVVYDSLRMSSRHVSSDEREERAQRIQLLCVSLVFAVFYGGCFILLARNNDWIGILELTAAFGAIALGVAIWAGMTVLLMYGGLGIASLWRTLRAARGDNP